MSRLAEKSSADGAETAAGPASEYTSESQRSVIAFGENVRGAIGVFLNRF